MTIRMPMSIARKYLIQQALAEVEEWDEFGQGFRAGECVVCICGQPYPMRDDVLEFPRPHYCPADDRERGLETMGDLCLHSIETDVLDGYVIRIQTPSYDSKRPRRSISAGTFNVRHSDEHKIGIILTVNDASDLIAIAAVLIEAVNQI